MHQLLFYSGGEQFSSGEMQLFWYSFLRCIPQWPHGATATLDFALICPVTSAPSFFFTPVMWLMLFTSYSLSGIKTKQLLLIRHTVITMWPSLQLTFKQHLQETSKNPLSGLLALSIMCWLQRQVCICLCLCTIYLMIVCKIILSNSN